MKRYGKNGIGEETTAVNLKEKRTGHSFIVRKGDLNLIVKNIPYSKIDEDEIRKNQNILKYGAFYFEKEKFEDMLTLVSTGPDDFKATFLKGNVLGDINNKSIELAKIRNGIGEKFYSILWNLPRGHLIALQNFGEGKISKEDLKAKRKDLENKITSMAKQISENKSLSGPDKDKLKYLIDNSPYIFNQNLVIGSGERADIKIAVEGISMIQGQIYPHESFNSIDYLNSGKYGANIIRFIGNYKDSEFVPLEYKINESVLADLDDERMQLTYLFLFGDSDLKEYEDFRASSLYLTFLKPQGKIEL